MRILGIDPGLRVCGYAVIDIQNAGFKLLEAGVFKSNAKKLIQERLHQIANDIDEILDRYEPDTVAVEKLYSHYAHPVTAILMGHARGVILQRTGSRNIDLCEYTPTRIKKSLTGNGHAGKPQMQRTIQSILGLTHVPEPADVADAIAIALCCANANSKIL